MYEQILPYDNVSSLGDKDRFTVRILLLFQKWEYTRTDPVILFTVSPV